MKNIFLYIISILSLAACITNDIPYPSLVPNITSVEVEGSEKVDIDFENRVVTVYMQETSDLRYVNITSFKIDQEIAKVSCQLIGVHDLSEKPLTFNVTTYADYEWTITAVREVERYFTAVGQIGSATIDAVNLRAFFSVGSSVDLTSVEVTSIKLGPEGAITTYEPDITQIVGATIDFTEAFNVSVTAFGVTEHWSIYADVVDLSVGIERINPWAHKAYVVAFGVAGEENTVMYRVRGSESWNEVPQSDITNNGGSFTAEIKGLKAETEYEVMAVSGEDQSEIVEFVTDAATPIPNGSFEHASVVPGTAYYKFYDENCGVEDGAYMFWGSGNGEGSEGVAGSASMGIIITYIDTDDKVDGKQSVRAQTSQLAGILAAGNLFTGQFAGLVGTSGGMVNFGRPWSTRPTALKLYCKYKTGTIDIITSMPPGVNLTKSDYDNAEIKVALGTWDYKKYGGTPDSPVHVNTTNPSTFVDFNTDASTIAAGGLIISNDGYSLNGAAKVNEATDNWVEYTIPLNYRNLEDYPTHLIISCAASRYGDYFTGCSTSKLWIDAVELIY